VLSCNWTNTRKAQKKRLTHRAQLLVYKSLPYRTTQRNIYDYVSSLRLRTDGPSSHGRRQGCGANKMRGAHPVLSTRVHGGRTCRANHLAQNRHATPSTRTLFIIDGVNEGTGANPLQNWSNVTRVEPRVGLEVGPEHIEHSYESTSCAGAKRRYGESTMSKYLDSSPEWGSLSCRSTRMQIRDRAGATLLWRVHNDKVFGFEPKVGLVVVPEHSYANTRSRWCDVVVESPQ